MNARDDQRCDHDRRRGPPPAATALLTPSSTPLTHPTFPPSSPSLQTHTHYHALHPPPPPHMSDLRPICFCGRMIWAEEESLVFGSGWLKMAIARTTLPTTFTWQGEEWGRGGGGCVREGRGEGVRGTREGESNRKLNLITLGRYPNLIIDNRLGHALQGRGAGEYSCDCHGTTQCAPT